MEHSKDGCDPRQQLEQPRGTFRSRGGCSSRARAAQLAGSMAGLALVVGTFACSNSSGPSALSADAGAASGELSPAEAAQVLARVGDHTITLGDYAGALQHMDQFDRLRYSAPARRRELLGEMIDVMLLADEARAKGYDKDPQTQQEIREILRDAIFQKARAGVPAPNDIPAPEVQAYFEEHKADFHDPERRRVSAVVLGSAASAASALDAATKTAVASADAGADANAEASARTWGELVRTRSIDGGGQGGVAGEGPLDLAGDLGFVSPPGDPRGINARIPDEVRSAVFEIANVGDVLPRVVPARGKFYVVKLQSKTAPRDLTLQDAERSIRVKLSEEKARASESALIDELRKQYPVEIDEAALAQVKVESPRDGGAP
jgi:peptidyl-prolyl cis-trans isomerase C